MADLIELGDGFTAERRENGQFAIAHKDCGLHMADSAEVAMVEEIERLRAELAELERDARRYRLLRDSLRPDAVVSSEIPAITHPRKSAITYSQEGLDVAIDAAIAAQEQK